MKLILTISLCIAFFTGYSFQKKDSTELHLIKTFTKQTDDSIKLNILNQLSAHFDQKK